MDRGEMRQKRQTAGTYKGGTRNNAGALGEGEMLRE